MTIKTKNNNHYNQTTVIFALIIAVFYIFYSNYAICEEKNPEKSLEKPNEIYKNKENQITYIRENKDFGLIGNYKDWNIYKIDTENYKTCYAISTPFITKGNKFNRAEPYFIVNNLINDADEIMITSGFLYKKNIDIEISIGIKKFYLFGYKNMAWTYNKNDDIEIIKEMQENDEFLVTYYNEEGKIKIDKYSLIGFRKAYFKLKETCKNLKK